MGQKTNPIGLRVAVTKDWGSKWFAEKKDFGKLLTEDREIRALLKKKLETASVPKILIERAMKLHPEDLELKKHGIEKEQYYEGFSIRPFSLTEAETVDRFRQQMRAQDIAVHDHVLLQVTQHAHARQPIAHDVDRGGIDRVHLPDVECPHDRHGSEQEGDDDRDLGPDRELGEHNSYLLLLDAQDRAAILMPTGIAISIPRRR